METYSASGVVSFNKMDFASEPVIFPRGREEKRKKKKEETSDGRIIGQSCYSEIGWDDPHPIHLHRDQFAMLDLAYGGLCCVSVGLDSSPIQTNLDSCAVMTL